MLPLDGCVAIRDQSEIYGLNPTRDEAIKRPSTRPARTAIRWAAWSKSASTGCRLGWARMRNGIASSTAGWHRP